MPVESSRAAEPEAPNLATPVFRVARRVSLQRVTVHVVNTAAREVRLTVAVLDLTGLR